MPHPIVLAVVILDCLSLLLILAAGLDALAVVLSWAPASPTAGQVRLERRAESAALRARSATFLFLASSLAFVLAVASVLPGIVPGAMCGTGVLQAMGGDGSQAFALRMAAMAVLGGWHLLDRLGRTRPDAPLATASARVLLLAIPLMAVAAWHTGKGLLGLEGQGPVDCCSVVYDGVRSAGAGDVPTGSWLLPAMFLSAALLVALGGAMAMSSRLARLPAASLVLAVLAAAWIPTAAVVLVRDLSPYHYGVLAHHCPWCLFAGRHGAVGYPLFGALAVVALDAGAAALASTVGRRLPQLSAPVAARVRIAAVRVVLAVLAFLVIGAGPALLWRLQNGVWMG
jgi:hypothetical protein